MEEEQWKPVTEAPTYEVSSLGRIRTQKAQLRQLTPGKNGYVQIALYKPDGAYIMRYVHRLVALEFMPNPEKHPQVHHKDGIRSNNQAINLEWVDSKTNSTARTPTKHKTRERPIVQLTLAGDVVRVWESTKAAASEMKVSRGQIQACLTGRHATSKGFRWVYQDNHDLAEPGEEWREVEDRKVVFRVSNLGRVRLPKSNQITFGARAVQYREITVNGSHFRIHRLVALAFIPQVEPENLVVNHKDGNPENNQACNLEWVTQQENIAHAVRMGRMRVTAVRRSGGGLEEKEYTSIAAAGIDNSIAPQNISRCVRVGLSAGGFKWTQILKEEDSVQCEALNSLSKGGVVAQNSDLVSDDDPIWKALGL